MCSVERGGVNWQLKLKLENEMKNAFLVDKEKGGSILTMSFNYFGCVGFDLVVLSLIWLC